MCGEKPTACGLPWLPPGSPPRMRGKALLRQRGNCCIGITPAYAGKSNRVGLAFNYDRDHPRTCGEKGFKEAGWQFIGGSPPHMRGKDAHPPRSSSPGGITPACAGKRVNGRKPAYNMRDHPRMCGEKSPSCTAIGSASRITPACAGKRKSCAEAKINAWDHPRMCGEKIPRT